MGPNTGKSIVNEALHLFAQTVVSNDAIGNYLQFGLSAGLLIWMITKAFPAVLERNESNHIEARQHFEKILDKIEANRAVAAKDGHDAARKIGDVLQEQVGAIRGNTESINRLTDQVARASHD
jgi:hypothetical protein